MSATYRFITKSTLVCFAAAVLCLSGCAKEPVTYCGEQEDDGPWTGCNAERYNVEGPAERLLDRGVSKIIMIDMTVGGVRFSKTFEVVQMTKRAVAAWELDQPEAPTPDTNKIGVLFIVHGGFAEYDPLHLWDASAQMFSYDHNHPVHLLYLWNPNGWDNILSSGNAEKEQVKYAFNYARLGGTDPFPGIVDRQTDDLQAALDDLGDANGLEFIVDWVAWMSGDDPAHYPFPRFMYNPDRYYSVEMANPATPVMWVNDYSELMQRSFPSEPEGWTRTNGLPDVDREVPLDSSSTNPVAEDERLAALHVAGIEASLSPTVADNETGILFLNHALHDNNEVFDPKINDTLSIIENVTSQLLDRHPDIDPENIVGSFMGVKTLNPENDRVERTRDMRGENLGHAYLYESDKQLPASPLGYRYWEGLDYLRGRGVKHVVISFTQIVADSVLNLVEIHNQIAKEVGYKNWLYYAVGDNNTYPGVGHPFADYWGIWVNTDCGGEECCFEMGGCRDGRVYPPPRQGSLNRSLSDMDPSLAYDVSEYGHLGYDPAAGAPDPNAAVQSQYTGTWALYRAPNDDPELTELLADHVLDAALGNLEQ
ncbi:hypothetical protein ACFL43_00985 [Thermodesulfobacteriota bacterium]